MKQTEKTSKNIGIDVKLPKRKCNDRNCPFHGRLRCNGKIFTGRVISTKMQKTATIEFERQSYLQKYERYEKKRTKLKAHTPECISVKEGDIVMVSNCRPLSKTKNFVVIENLGKERGFEERMEALEEGKTRKKEQEKKGDEKEDASSESKNN